MVGRGDFFLDCFVLRLCEEWCYRVMRFEILILGLESLIEEWL